MIMRFQYLDLSFNFYEGVDLFTDPRTKEFNISASSCMYGHLDMIYKFYFNTNKKYGIFCEDDILIDNN